MFTVAVGSASWFRENLPNHAAAARAIESGEPEKARHAMERVLGYTKFKLSAHKKGAHSDDRRMAPWASAAKFDEPAKPAKAPQGYVRPATFPEKP